MEEMKNGTAENKKAEIMITGTEESTETKNKTDTAEETFDPEKIDTTNPAEVARAQSFFSEKLRKQLEEQRRLIDAANEAISQGKGRMTLETPIRAHDTEYTELAWDFTVMKGYEYTDAMDSDRNAGNAFNITRRQALALFAKSAAKQTGGMDMQDIVEQLGYTDSVEAVEIAMLFFTASRRAGRTRISKL